jgi:GGDEF domain-containing protein
MNPVLLEKDDYFNFVDKLSLTNNISCIVLDIDNSKEIIGQMLNPDIECLIRDVLLNTFKSVTSQIGRDAFSCLIEKPVSIFELAKLKNTAENSISKEIEKEITFCMGIAQTANSGKSTNEIFALAYEALFLAKKQGANSIHFYQDEPMKLKSLYFRKSQLEQLSQFAKAFGENDSFIIRRALDEFIKNHIY